MAFTVLEYCEGVRSDTGQIWTPELLPLEANNGFHKMTEGEELSVPQGRVMRSTAKGAGAR